MYSWTALRIILSSYFALNSATQRQFSIALEISETKLPEFFYQITVFHNPWKDAVTLVTAAE